MPTLSDIEGSPLVSADGRALGTVAHVLFHPAEPRAVALMVDRPRVMVVIPRKAGFAPIGAISFADGDARLDARRLPRRSAVAAAVGADLESTVIWRGMPVVSSTGRRVGTVADARISQDGELLGLTVTTGALGDLAHGRLDVPAERVRGFREMAVVILDEEPDLEADGGLARSVAKGATKVKVTTSATAKAAGEALVDASYITGRALASAARSKPVRRARTALKGVADAFRDGYDGDEKPPSE
jgi:sporulation protein YlmC with PRC-barrel domain